MIIAIAELKQIIKEETQKLLMEIIDDESYPEEFDVLKAQAAVLKRQEEEELAEAPPQEVNVTDVMKAAQELADLKAQEKAAALDNIPVEDYPTTELSPAAMAQAKAESGMPLSPSEQDDITAQSMDAMGIGQEDEWAIMTPSEIKNKTVTAIDDEGYPHQITDIYKKGRFKHVREKWADAYEHGANRAAWIEHLKSRRPRPYGLRYNPTDKDFNAYYEKHVLPQALDIIQNTPVYTTAKKPSRSGGGSFYSDKVGAVRSRGAPSEGTPYAGSGIYLNKKHNFKDPHLKYKADTIFAHELGHALDDRMSTKKTTGYTGSEEPASIGALMSDRITSSDPQERWKGSAHVARERYGSDMGEIQAEKIKQICKDCDNTDVFNDLKEKGKSDHSYRSQEIYSNIIDTRMRLGKPFGAVHIARIRRGLSPSWVPPDRSKPPVRGSVEAAASTEKQYQEIIDSRRKNREANSIMLHSAGDLTRMLSRPANQKLSDQEIADILNSIAAVDTDEAVPDRFRIAKV